jgi:hypothetical protein
MRFEDDTIGEALGRLHSAQCGALGCLGHKALRIDLFDRIGDHKSRNARAMGACCLDRTGQELGCRMAAGTIMNEDDLRLISGQRFQPPKHRGLAGVATRYGRPAESARFRWQIGKDSCEEWFVTRPDHGLDGGAEG